MENIINMAGKEIRISYFMNNKLKKANDHASAESKLVTLLTPYDVLGPVAALPDFTDSDSLPIGTTAIIDASKTPINPQMIGMDIGCGYNFFSAELNPRRFYKKGKLKENNIARLIDLIGSMINPSTRNYDKHFGTIGKGNHFVDIYVLDEAYDKHKAQYFGLLEDRIYFLIHSGSRDVGFQTNSELMELYQNTNDVSGFNIDYISRFNTALVYARSNREEIRKSIGCALEDFNCMEVVTKAIFDKPHNTVNLVPGQDNCFKIQKGTTSLEEGEVFVIPGNCTSHAYAVVGLPGLKSTYNTINHGAGRKYTRAQIFSKCINSSVDHFFRDVVLNVTPKKMIEELPIAYKNIDDVIDSVEETGLAKRIARLKIIGVIVDRK